MALNREKNAKKMKIGRKDMLCIKIIVSRHQGKQRKHVCVFDSREVIDMCAVAQSRKLKMKTAAEKAAYNSIFLQSFCFKKPCTQLGCNLKTKSKTVEMKHLIFLSNR